MAIQDYVKVYRDKGRDAWGKLTGRQRLIFAGLGVGVVALFVAVIIGFGSGSGGMVEIKVPVSDPTAAVRRLAVYGIKSEHNLTKAAVMVPAEMEQKAAMILTFTGLLPDGRKAYDFLSEANLAMTDQRTRMQYITRLQDMLSETIAASPDISQAEVFLTEHGKPHEFRLPDFNLAPKASVKVELTNGGRLTEEQQLSIASLVAGSFTALSESNVRISDFNLNFYPTIDENWRMNFTVRSTQLNEQASAARKIELVLSQYHAQASVTIAMKTAKQGIVETLLEGEAKPLDQTTRKFAEKSRGLHGTSGQEGDAGRDGAFDPGRSVTDSERTEDTKTTRSDYNRKQITTQDDLPRPDYAASSAAVRVITDETLSPEQMNQIQLMAARATLIPPQNIQVMAAPPAAMAALGAGGGSTGGVMEFLNSEHAPKLILLLIALGAVVALMVMLRKSAPKPLTMVDEALLAEAEEDVIDIPGLPPVDQLHGNLVREKVVELVRKNPKAAANLVKRWMIFGK